MSHVGVHDLKPLLEDVYVLLRLVLKIDKTCLGHKSEGITTHYSQFEYSNLIRAANKVCDLKNNLVILSRKEKLLAPAKIPQENFLDHLKVV